MASAERHALDQQLTAEEARMAQAAAQVIMASLDHSRAATITLESDDGTQPSVKVPPKVLRLLGKALSMMAQRHPVTLISEHQELSTVEAANFLNVSRPFVIKEIEAGRLKHRMVGTHRRILYQDLLEYSEAMRAQQKQALERMARHAYELGLDD